MGKKKRVRNSRRKRNPQVDPQLQLLHDHAVLAQAKIARERKADHDNSSSS